ncbi:hypothetical protein BDV27DRAFT_161065 [Aspergillus caelatus]|uniref:Rhodopsin domain-containing protein n=1 Tax=Aspergillus caelatus TaxID=61420 RepID=A0A5N6ZU46_9EURO|nr:uncharacterized protein BDV27DRAFT_161065 [Aspergillus caelatus]KAE8361052.1 hypothetical protein BDV27DRAFT_161065 [Aspergillus caelatus]
MDSPSESATGILTIIGNNPSSFTDDIIPLSSIGVKVVIVDVFLIFMTIVFTSLRIISRRLRGQKLFPEDYLHIASMICFQGIGFLSIAMFVRGFGHHIWELQIFHIAPLLKVCVPPSGAPIARMHQLARPPAHIVVLHLLQMYYALMILYAISLGLVKISICWSLARIFSTPLLVFGARILMVVSALWAITTIFISIIFCHTIGLDWSMFSTDEHCLNLTVAYGILAAVDVLVDLFILVLPFPTLWSLQMPKSTRVALTFVFSTGIL